MLRTIFLVLFLLSSYFSFSQNNSSSLENAFILRGTYLLGGGISTTFKGYKSQVDNKTADTGSILDLNLDAKVGYFFWKDISIGLKTGFNHNNLRSDSTNNDVKRTVVLAGPFVRGYLDNGLFGEVSGQWGLDNIGGGSGVQSDLFNGEIGIGYSYFLGYVGRQSYWLRNKQIAIEPMLLFRYFKQTYGGTSASQNYYAEYGPEFRISLQVYIFKQTMMLPTPIKKSKR